MSSNKGKMTTIADLKVQEHLDPLGKVLFNKGFKLNEAAVVHHPVAVATAAKPRLSFTTNKAGHLAASVGQRSKIVLLKSSKPLQPPPPSTMQQQQRPRQVVVTSSPAKPSSSSSSSSSLLVRQQPQTGFVCDFTGCGQTFDKAALLRRHAKIHEVDVEVKETKARAATAAATTTTTVAAATAAAAGPFANFAGAKTLPFVCSICGMSFRFKGMCQITTKKYYTQYTVE